MEYRTLDYDGRLVNTFDVDGSRLLYDNGLPFTGGQRSDGRDLHAYNLDQLIERIDAGKASMILIDGTGLGEGKTTLCVHTEDYIAGKWIRFEEGLFMGGEKFIKGLKICYIKGMKVAGYDESGDFDKKGALSKLNKILNRVFDIYRAFKILVILVLPNFLVLDNGLFDKNIPRMLIHCSGRTKKQGNFAVYDLSRMLWIREYAKKSVIKSDAFRRVQPNYRGHFLNLSSARSRELDKFSTSGKLEVVDIAEIKGEGLLSYSEIAQKIKRSEAWVRRKCGSLGIVASKVYKGKKYYDENTVDQLKRERSE